MAEEWRKINILFKEEELEAWLVVPIFGEEGAVKAILTAEDAFKALKAKGVENGILEDEIQRIFRDAVFEQEVLVARGTPPVQGEDGKIEYYFKTSREMRPKEDEDGRIDYREISFLENVKQGDKLCRKIPATSGRAGISVTKKPIPPQEGRTALLPQGPNTEIAPADSDLLIAAGNGCVTINQAKLVEVQPKLEIKGDVDFSTGNINFVGALVINGDVKAGFKVAVSGDLEINGTVEDAEVRCGGNALLKMGFTGHNKGLVTTAGDLTVKFAQNQQIQCEGNLYLGGELMHCDTKVGGDVIASGRKGAIIGGQVQARGSVEVCQLGSINFTPTVIEAGCNFKALERKQEIRQELEKIKINQEKVKNALYVLARLKIKMQGNLPPDQLTLYNRLQDTVQYYPRYREQLTSENDKLDAEIAQHKNSSVTIHQVLYPGVKVLIGRYPRVFKEQMQHAVLREVRGEIIPVL